MSARYPRLDHHDGELDEKPEWLDAHLRKTDDQRRVPATRRHHRLCGWTASARRRAESSNPSCADTERTLVLAGIYTADHHKMGIPWCRPRPVRRTRCLQLHPDHRRPWRRTPMLQLTGGPRRVVSHTTVFEPPAARIDIAGLVPDWEATKARMKEGPPFSKGGAFG